MRWGGAAIYQVGVVAGYTSFMGIGRKMRTAELILHYACDWDHRVIRQILYSLAS